MGLSWLGFCIFPSIGFFIRFLRQCDLKKHLAKRLNISFYKLLALVFSNVGNIKFQVVFLTQVDFRLNCMLRYFARNIMSLPFEFHIKNKIWAKINMSSYFLKCYFSIKKLQKEDYWYHYRTRYAPRPTNIKLAKENPRPLLVFLCYITINLLSIFLWI